MQIGMLTEPQKQINHWQEIIHIHLNHTAISLGIQLLVINAIVWHPVQPLKPG